MRRLKHQQHQTAVATLTAATHARPSALCCVVHPCVPSSISNVNNNNCNINNSSNIIILTPLSVAVAAAAAASTVLLAVRGRRRPRYGPSLPGRTGDRAPTRTGSGAGGSTVLNIRLIGPGYPDYPKGTVFLVFWLFCHVSIRLAPPGSRRASWQSRPRPRPRRGPSGEPAPRKRSGFRRILKLVVDDGKSCFIKNEDCN